MNKNQVGGVYEIVNKIDGNCYVGSSVNLKRRFREHRTDLKRNCHSNMHLQNAYNKYGKENFLYNILAFTDPEYGLELENLLLKSLRYKYNIALDSTAPMLGLTGQLCPNYGRKWTEEQKENLRKNRADVSGTNNPMYGKDFSDEHRRKLKRARSKRIGMFAPCYGKTKTKESRVKTSRAVIGNKHPRWIHLSDSEISEMKLLKEQGFTIKDIAKMFDVSWETAKRRIYDISRSKYA